MKQAKEKPKWLDNLRALMAHRGFNARSLSLRAGLNATAVRDMFEGRARFPRYDTIESLSHALNVTPAQLMAGTPESVIENYASQEREGLVADELELLTEIITRLLEEAEMQKQHIKPHDFSAMVTSIFRQIQDIPAGKITRAGLEPHINHLISYEALRNRKGSAKRK